MIRFGMGKAQRADQRRFLAGATCPTAVRTQGPGFDSPVSDARPQDGSAERQRSLIGEIEGP